MSAYKKIKCNLVNKESLLKALEVLGFQADVYENAVNLKGYRNDIRKEVANIIVTKEQLNSFTGASNDTAEGRQKNRRVEMEIKFE